jgi:hypothetical protein
MTDSSSENTQAPPPPPEPPKAKDAKPRPAMRANERLIGRSILRSGGGPKR